MSPGKIANLVEIADVNRNPNIGGVAVVEEMFEAEFDPRMEPISSRKRGIWRYFKCQISRIRDRKSSLIKGILQ